MIQNKAFFGGFGKSLFDPAVLLLIIFGMFFFDLLSTPLLFAGVFLVAWLVLKEIIKFGIDLASAVAIIAFSMVAFA
jgi:hypothetical protein